MAAKSPRRTIQKTPRIATPRGDFVFRPQSADDDAFLFRLFKANNTKLLQLAGFPDEAIEKLVTFQYRSQIATHRGMFPNAIYSIARRFTLLSAQLSIASAKSTF